MSSGDFLFDDSNAESVNNYLEIYKSVKEATVNSKLIFLDNQELEDSITYFIDEEEPQKALEIINYSLAIFSGNIEFLLLKAEVLIDLKLYDDVLILLSQIECKEPYNTRIYLLRASVYEINKDDVKVISEYHKALFNDVNEPELIYEELGFYYMTKENYKDALKSFKKCIELDQDNNPVFDALTDIYIEQGALDGLTFFEQFTHSYTECINAWFSVGRLFQSEELYHKAIKAYEKVLQIEKFHLISIENVIYCLRQTDNFKRIIKICNHYINFMHPYFVYEIAETYFDMGEVEESFKYYYQLHDENPNDVEALLGIARCYSFQGLYNKAFQFIDIGLKKNADNVDLLVFNGLLLKETGNYIKATEILEKALSLESENDSSEACFELADIYCETEDYIAAIEVLQKGIDENFKNSRLMFLLAACYYNLNDKVKAYFSFEEAIGIDNCGYDIFFKNCFSAQEDNFFWETIQKNDSK